MGRTIAWTLGLALLTSLATPTPAVAAFLAFTPDPATGSEQNSEGCYPEPGLARGLLTPSSAGSTCHSGLLGSQSDVAVFAGQAPTEAVAAFETAVLASPLTLGGPATLTVHYAVDTGGAAVLGQDTASTLDYELREKHAAGHFTTIASGSAFTLNPGLDHGSGSFEVPAYSLSPGSTLQMVLMTSGPSEARIYFGGAYSDSGMTLAVADGESGGVGALPPVLLALLLVMAATRRRRR